MPVEWKECTEERYWEMLECVPPAVMGGGGFMVGEPYDHIQDAETGKWVPTFHAFRKIAGKHYAASAPMTIREFRKVCPGAADYAYSEWSCIA